MSNSITIRPLLDSDLDAVVNLYNNGGFGPVAGGYPLSTYALRRSLDEHGQLLFLVAECVEQQAIVGTLALLNSSEQFVARPEEAFATYFFIHPEFRNGRIPNQLFITALLTLLREGYACIHTTVNPANVTAMALYKRIGLYRTRASNIDYDGQLELRGYQPLVIRAIKQMKLPTVEALPHSDSSWRFLTPTQSIRSSDYDSEFWHGLEVITYALDVADQKMVFRVDVLNNGIVSMEANDVQFHMYPDISHESLTGSVPSLIFELTNTAPCPQTYAVSFQGADAETIEVLPRREFQPGETWHHRVSLSLSELRTHILRSTLHTELGSLDFQVGVTLKAGLSALRLRPLQIVRSQEPLQIPLRLVNAHQFALRGEVKALCPSLPQILCQPAQVSLEAQGAVDITLACDPVSAGTYPLALRIQSQHGVFWQAQPFVQPVIEAGQPVVYEEFSAYVLESSALRVCIDKNTGYLRVWDKASETLALNEAWPDVGPPFPGGLKRGVARSISRVPSSSAEEEDQASLSLVECTPAGASLWRHLYFIDDHLIAVQQCWQATGIAQTARQLKTYGWCAFRKDVLSVPLRAERVTRPVIYGEYPYALHDFDNVPSADLPTHAADYSATWSAFEEAGLTVGMLWQDAAEICYGLHWMPSLLFSLPATAQRVTLPTCAYYVGPGGADAVAQRWELHYGHGETTHTAHSVELPTLVQPDPQAHTLLEAIFQLDHGAYHPVTVTETSQHSRYQVDNGALRFQIAPDFAGSIYNLTYKGINLLQSGLPRSRPFGENGIWYGGIHPYRVPDRTNLLASILCDPACEQTFTAQPVTSRDAAGRIWQGVGLVSKDLCIRYEVLPALPLLRLSAEFSNTRNIDQSFDLIFHAFLRSLQGNRVPKTLYYERAGNPYSVHEEQKNRKIYTDNWSIVTPGKDIAVVCFAPPAEKLEIATYEWAKDGMQHALIQHFHVAPGQTQRSHAYLLITDSLEQAFSIVQPLRSAPALKGETLCA